MIITREMLREWGTCYSEEEIDALVPPDGVTPMQVADAVGVPVDDRLWVLLRLLACVWADRLRLLACDWAERACQTAGHGDPRSLAAIAVARRYARGEATRKELAAARGAARVAAWAAARDDARDTEWAAEGAAWAAEAAARVTAWDDARDDARDTEWAAEGAAWAAEAAARVTAWDDARARQLAGVRRVLLELHQQNEGELCTASES